MGQNQSGPSDAEGGEPGANHDLDAQEWTEEFSKEYSRLRQSELGDPDEPSREEEVPPEFDDLTEAALAERDRVLPPRVPLKERLGYPEVQPSGRSREAGGEGAGTENRYATDGGRPHGDESHHRRKRPRGAFDAAPGDALRPNAAARMCNGKADPDVCGQLPPEECEAPGVQAFCPVHCNGCPAGVGAAGAGARGAGDPVSTAPRRETPGASRAEAETEASKDVFTPSVIGGVAGCAALFATLALVRWWRPRNTQAQPGAHDEEELHGTQLPAPAKQGSAGNNRVAETALDDDYTNLDDDYTEIGTSAPADDTYDLGHVTNAAGSTYDLGHAPGTDTYDLGHASDAMGSTYDLGHAPGTDTYDLGHGQAAPAAGKTPHERVVNSEGDVDSEEEI